MSNLLQFGGTLKSVQRGSTSCGVATAVNTTITAVDMSKSFVLSSVNGGFSGLSDTNGGVSYTVGTGAAYLTSTTNLACISSTGASLASVVYWEVIEFY